MKKTLYVFLLAALFLGGCSWCRVCTESERVRIEMRYLNGQLRYKGVFLRGTGYEGRWVYYSAAGHKLGDAIYRRGKPWDGLFPHLGTTPDFNWVPIEEYTNGVVVAIPDQSDDDTYPNGKIRGQGTTRDGKRDGRWTWYTPTGRTYASGLYRAGKPWHGLFPASSSESHHVVEEYTNGVPNPELLRELTVGK